MYLGEHLYHCQQLDPFTKKSPFKRSNTWGDSYYAVQVSNDTEAVTYNFTIEPNSYFTVAAKHAPFRGVIDIQGNNLMLLFGGFLLLEQVLDFDSPE
jgi:hypothetical protein